MPSIAAMRLHNQRLAGTKCQTPQDVVKWLGAVQAQEYAHAKWGLALRLNGFTDDDIEPHIENGTILRTHVMRPTWHFVAAEDIRWLLELTSPRVHAVSAYMYRKTGLDETVFRRNRDVLVKALEGGKHLTRSELGEALAEAGIEADGFRLSYLMMHAELEAVICSGARRGKQFTYALLDERAPNAKKLSRNEALAELTKRFFTSHGPAMIQDFAWWSGLTVADVKAGLEMVKDHLVQEVIGGKTYWHAGAAEAELLTPTALLLPIYDEYGIAYKDHSGILDPQYSEQAAGATFGGLIVIDGIGVGMWRRTFSKGTVLVEARPFRPFSAAESDAFAAAAQQFGEFLKMPVVIS